jgi:hypothetical protein
MSKPVFAGELSKINQTIKDLPKNSSNFSNLQTSGQNISAIALREEPVSLLLFFLLDFKGGFCEKIKFERQLIFKDSNCIGIQLN